MSARILAMSASCAAVLLSVLGCGAETPTYDPAVRYSPESLAREFAFQYKSLKAGGPAVDPSGKSGPKEATGIAVKSVKEATKESPVATLESLVADIVRKAATVPGLSRAEACRRVAGLVEQDASIAEADRKAVAARLGSLAP